MTPAEKAHARAQKLKERIAADQQALAQVQAQQRAQERRARDKRRYRVGALLDEAGLFVWDDGTLRGIVAVLATLKEVPHPVAVLEAMLCDPVAVEGLQAAHSEHRGPDLGSIEGHF